MKCPACGHENSGKAHQCAKCDVIFIKWLISQYRAEHAGAGNGAARTPSAGIPLPASFSRGAAAALLLAGFGVGFLSASFVPKGLLRFGRRAPRVEDISGRTIEERLGPALGEARAAGRERSVLIGTADLGWFFRQGFELFNEETLRDAAERAGEPVEIEIVRAGEYLTRKGTPYRCRGEGEWRYLEALPADRGDTLECWGLSRRRVRSGKDFVVGWEIFWQEYGWFEPPGRWSLFSPADEMRLFEFHIEDALGPDAVRRDGSESAAALAEAGGDPGAVKTALVTAFRTRARRAGARYRLELTR